MAERGEVVGNVVYGYVKAAIKRVHNEPHVEVLPAHLPPG